MTLNGQTLNLVRKLGSTVVSAKLCDPGEIL